MSVVSLGELNKFYFQSAPSDNFEHFFLNTKEHINGIY